MTVATRSYRGASAASGPLLFLQGCRRVALGEWVEIDEPGEPARTGQVIDASNDTTVVQVLEDTVGLSPGRSVLRLTGRTVTATVGRELLGRVLNGLGQPLDGMPAAIGEGRVEVAGSPVNPASRLPPSDFIETGLSAIDGLNTLVRGQKLPIFAGAGMPALDLGARVVEWARVVGDEPFAVLFVALGITERETRTFLQRFEASDILERSVVYLNQARDPAIERLLAPRVALSQAEFLAFELGFQVLVVIADMLHYCDALREIAAAREEVPGRRGYPGYMYTDLASLFERAGLMQGRSGSITQLPILTMPDDDITHPIPDLTGYITEGQLVLSRELLRRAVFPPVDVLPSLSRLMNAAIGANRTFTDHRAWANRLYAAYARGRDSRLTATIVGEAGLQDEDRVSIEFANRFELEFVNQGDRRRTMDETATIGRDLLDWYDAGPAAAVKGER
jgi:V/A-type H+/Na+-transporting ATPase subunit B